MESQRQLLRWGLGMDRGTGEASANPEGMADLRNVLILDGALKLRGGIGASGAAVPSEDVICALGLFQAISRTIIVTWNRTTRDVTVYEADLLGNTPVLVGVWGALSATADEPPRFTMAESFSILVLAHDEPNVAQRLDTFRYDPNDLINPWLEVSADLDGGGSAPVVAREVWTHLGYVFYAGYGSVTTPSRPEIVRVSLADDPTSLDAQHYFLVGARDSPVLGGASVRDVCAVFKGDSVYRITGSSRATWGLELVDGLTGAVSARSIYPLHGFLYFWSVDGPRRTDGYVVVPIDYELDSLGPVPPDLPVAGPLSACFAFLVSESRHLVFAFPQPGVGRTLAVALSLWREQAPRWCYWPLEAEVLCAALTAPGLVISAVPPGYASNVTTQGSVGAATGSIQVWWDHNDPVGDESIEIWYKPAAGSWSLVQTVPINTSTPTSPNQGTAFGTGVVAGAYEVQVRYRRGTRFYTGYEDPDPDLWPAGSLAAGTVIIIAVPVMTGATYDPATGQLSLSWTMATASADIDVVLSRYVFPNPVPVNYATIPLAPGTLSTTVDSVAFGSPLYQMREAQQDFFNQKTVRVQVRGRIGAVLGSPSIALVDRFIGVDETPSGLSDSVSKASVALGTEVTVGWTNVPSAGALAPGATVVGFRTISQTPANAGSPAGVDLGSVALPATTLVAPMPVPAAGCQLVGQTVRYTELVVQQRLDGPGFVNWTREGILAPTISAVCAP